MTAQQYFAKPVPTSVYSFSLPDVPIVEEGIRLVTKLGLFLWLY
jgi:hypothetical protein